MNALGWKSRFSRALPIFILALCVFPAPAHAHTTIKGMGDFVSGLAHPLTTPSHVLILLALGLMLGQHAPLKLKIPLLVFAPLSALALILTTTRFAITVYQPVLIGIALFAATLVALEKKIPSAAIAGLLAIAALALGFDSAVESETTAVIIKSLLGIWVALVVVLFDLAFYISRCTEKKWMKVGIRVLGSWIIAISLLVLAFSLKK